MHSRIIRKTLVTSLRAGLVTLSLSCGLSAGENTLYQPMSGACFVHDSGLEYIPTRLLGIQDTAIHLDREDSDSWTCSEVAADCAKQAEIYQRQQTTIEQWNRWCSLVQNLRSWTGASVASGFARSLSQWNAGLVSVGRGLAHRFSHAELDEPDCPWDRTLVCGEIANQVVEIEGQIPRSGTANLFVFALGSGVALTSEEDSLDSGRKTETDAIAPSSEPTIDSLKGTTFARDYCVFAPYPLSERDSLCTPGGVDGAMSSEPKEVLRLQQRAAVDLQRAASKVLAKNMSWLGNSLLRWSEDLDRSVRIAESIDSNPRDDVK